MQKLFTDGSPAAGSHLECFRPLGLPLKLLVLGAEVMMPFYLLVLFLSVLSVGCVEVRNSKPKVESPVVESPVASQPREAALPPDLVVEEPVYFYQDNFYSEEQLYHKRVSLDQVWSQEPQKAKLVYHKIILSEKGVLYIGPHQIHLQAEVLFSQEGKIKTYLEGQKASLNHAGRHGGHVHLSVNKAEGFLYISLAGEKGGDGKDMNRRPQVFADRFCQHTWGGNISGARGGDSGLLTGSILQASAFQVFVSIVPGLGGQPETMHTFTTQKVGALTGVPCNHQVSPAQAGASGTAQSSMLYLNQVPVDYSQTK